LEKRNRGQTIGKWRRAAGERRPRPAAAPKLGAVRLQTEPVARTLTHEEKNAHGGAVASGRAEARTVAPRETPGIANATVTQRGPNPDGGLVAEKIGSTLLLAEKDQTQADRPSAEEERGRRRACRIIPRLKKRAENQQRNSQHKKPATRAAARDSGRRHSRGRRGFERRLDSQP
jgi:hypothetical protein